jgi:hypothetical protein
MYANRLSTSQGAGQAELLHCYEVMGAILIDLGGALLNSIFDAEWMKRVLHS